MGVLLAVLAATIGLGSLLIGTTIAWVWDVPKKLVAAVLAIGAGVLIATLALALVDEAQKASGPWLVALAFGVGAGLYVAADAGVTRLSQKHQEHEEHKRGRNATAKRGGDSEGGIAPIATGALLDGIPEAIVIGLAAVGGNFPVAIVAAVALGNIPEGLAGTVPLKKSGRSAGRAFGIWGGIALACIAVAALSAAFMEGAGDEVVAIAQAFGAGALLAMVANAMLPEAYELEHRATGLLTAAGFVVAFLLHELL